MDAKDCREVKTMTQSTQDQFKDLNWSLTEFDRIIDVILSNLTTIKEELHVKDLRKERIVTDYHDILNFKIETVYSLLIKLEELVFNTTFAYYRKYHGSFRGELSLVEFENVKREVSYIFDSFLAQYKSLLDLVVKFVSEFTLADYPQLSKVTLLDSFENMLDIMIKLDKSKFKKIYRLLNKSGKFAYLQKLFQNFIKKKDFLEEIKDYRDYIIHHGYFRHQLKAKSTEGQVIFSYWIPRLIRTGKTYKIDPSTNLKLGYFCRDKTYLLLSLIAEITDLIYDESFKQPYIDNLNSFSPELVKDVILKVSRKDFWADRVVSEEELKVLLKSKEIGFDELVEDFIHTEREKKDGKKAEKTFLPFEKMYYKPIGKIRVFRTKFILKPMYSVMFSGLSLRDFISQKPELADILDTLRRAGLVYLIKTKEEIRYASIKYDLTSLIFSLDELSRFKWSFIQIPEIEYFRSRTPEETKILREILGEKADEYLKKEDEERNRFQKEYREWKKQPEHYFTDPLDIVDKDGKTITRITHKEYAEEKNVNFQNWKQNKRVVHIKKEDGQTETVTTPFFSDKDMDQKWLENLIRACKKQWKGQPKHFLEFEKEMIRKHKKEYNASLEKFRKESKPIIEKYKYLMPIFTLLNQDVFVQ
jgi:hypothetical protein